MKEKNNASGGNGKQSNKRTVLLCVYDEQMSTAMCDFVSSHEWEPNTEFHVLFVLELDGLPILAPALIVDIESQERKYGEQVCRTVSRALAQKLPNYRVTTHIQVGPAREQILNLAREIGSDLIVIGSRPHKGLDNLLYGSVSFDIAKHADCSTLVVRLPGDTSADLNKLNMTVEDLPEQMVPR